MGRSRGVKKLTFSILEAEAVILFKLEAEALALKKPALWSRSCLRPMSANQTHGKNTQLKNLFKLSLDKLDEIV